MVVLDGTVQLRRDTSANWISSNPVLLLGELGWDTTNNLVKIGDGVNTWTSLQAGPPGESFIRNDALRTLTSTTALQKMFGTPTNGALSLPVGAYRFRCGYLCASMSTTSGNSSFSLIGAGTAVLGAILMWATGVDNAPTNASTQLSGAMVQAAAFPQPQHTAATGAAQSTHIEGTFEVTTAGTIIPSIALGTAIAATISAGSFFECWSIGNTSQVTVGNWA